MLTKTKIITTELLKINTAFIWYLIFYWSSSCFWKINSWHFRNEPCICFVSSLKMQYAHFFRYICFSRTVALLIHQFKCKLVGQRKRAIVLLRKYKSSRTMSLGISRISLWHRYDNRISILVDDIFSSQNTERIDERRQSADSGKQKACRKRALMISVAYFWPDFVESYSFSAESVGAAVVLLSYTR